MASVTICCWVFSSSLATSASFSDHVLANANEHVVPSQEHDVAVEIFADVRVDLHDSLDVVSWIPLASLPVKLGLYGNMVMRTSAVPRRPSTQWLPHWVWRLTWVASKRLLWTCPICA